MNTFLWMLTGYLLYNCIIAWYLRSVDENPEEFKLWFMIQIILFAPIVMWVGARASKGKPIMGLR